MAHNAQALDCYESALRHNKTSIEALRSVASILRAEDKYENAVDYIRMILQLSPSDGESWSSLGRDGRRFENGHTLTNLSGHCYLMMDELQQAYTAYQSALYNLRDPKVRETVSVNIQLNLILFLTGTQIVVWHRNTL